MSRLRISEFAAKKLLIGDTYDGYSFDSVGNITIPYDPKTTYAVKVDDGTKKRHQRGLVSLSLDAKAAELEAKHFLNKGYRRVLIEPMRNHNPDDECYISCTLTRNGVSVIYSSTGGVHVEATAKTHTELTVSRKNFTTGAPVIEEAIPSVVLNTLLQAMRLYHMSFVEINPFVQTGADVTYLDAAVEIDSTALCRLPDWVANHIQSTTAKHPSELQVAELNAHSGASFTLNVFDPHAAIFTLLSGGGASLVTLDALIDAGLQSHIANYSEYSGAPSRAETKAYTDALVSLILQSNAPRKVLVIAGGVANFTDIGTTFEGIIDSLTDNIVDLRNHSIALCVRRGGPRHAYGLQLITDFADRYTIPAIISNPQMTLAGVADTTVQLFQSS